jgi:hypothetical protein
MPQVVNPATTRNPRYRQRAVPADQDWDEELPPGSPVKAWATHLGILGTVGGGLLVCLLKWTDLDLITALVKLFPDAEPMKLSSTLYGSIVGLAIGALLVVVVGRSWESLCGLLLTAVAGGLYGALLEIPKMGQLPGMNLAVLVAPFPAMNLAVLILGALAGTLAGALLGVIIGAIIAVARS